MNVVQDCIALSLSLSIQYEYQMYVRCKQSIWNVIYSNIHPKKCKNSKKHVHVLMLVFFLKFLYTSETICYS